ncbi:AIPR family protein [Streptomyces zhihengii]
MTLSALPLPDVPTQVRQVTKAFTDTYTELIDMSDWAGRPETQWANAMLSRALTAHAVRIVTGCSPREAAMTVIDGGADQGIDAIAIVEEPAHVFLVQAKWSSKGTATAKTDAVHKLLAGLRLIDSEEFSQFNPKGRELAEKAKALMGTGAVAVTQVIALMGTDTVSHEARAAIANGESEFNKHGDILGHRIIHAAEIWKQVREDIAIRPVDMSANLFPWFSISSPYESYQGVVHAEEVAGWVRDHGSNLFNLNIRNPLGLTSINNELTATLTQEPARFLYFNNGITILCESVKKSQQSLLAPEQHPLGLVLNGASVVNGAQTVRSIADAVAKGSGDAAYAKVGVRVIVTGEARDFAKKVTQSTNRQNRIEARDFVSLDPVQASLMEEMKAEFGLDYSVRRSELDPPADSGCSIVEAACALACAHSNSQYSARIANSLDVLWERGSQGVYDILFHPQPSVYQLWNSVRVLRSVRSRLHELRPQYEGRGAAAVEHGTYLIAHIVFRLLDRDAISGADAEATEQALANVPALVDRVVPALVIAMDAVGERAQIRAMCTDTRKCKELTAEVLRLLDGGGTAPAENKYRRSVRPRKTRRPNAVHVIVDKSALEEGTPLTLHMVLQPEIDALTAWLAEDPLRARATWVNHRSKPILWTADGQRYSPSGLVAKMWELAEWEGRPVANQGTARWTVPSGETLARLAWKLLAAQSDDEDEDSVAEPLD